MASAPHIQLRKGFDLRLEGVPSVSVTDLPAPARIVVCPAEFREIKPRCHVKEGDRIRRGAVLFADKKNEALRFRAPAGGTVESIVLGERRALERIVIAVDAQAPAEEFPRQTVEGVLAMSREQVLAHIQDTGLLALIRQRPFSRMADPTARPKSVFVNAMNSAPFLPDAAAAVNGHEPAFQAGLNALTRLTKGAVHLCLPAGRELPPALASAAPVEIHRFAGPHPAGNTSVHIHHIDPIRPQDIVWTIRAADLVLIGRSLLEGTLPARRIITVGGNGVKPEARAHYRVQIGTSVGEVLQGRLADGEQRIINGDILSGAAVGPEACVGLRTQALNVIPEDRRRDLLGWILPGLTQFSLSRAFLSRWLRPNHTWALGTNRHGSERPMILTGLYDRYLPMRILTDFLVRAVLAHDTDEAVRLGLLETDPEDFALCAFACPSKMDLVGIIRRGLEDVEREGL